MAKKRSLRDVAISILTESPTPLRPETIAARAIATGALPPDDASIEAAMGDVLDADVDRNGGRSAFVRVSPGHYGLNAARLPGSESASHGAGMPATRKLKDAAAAILRGSLDPLPIGLIANRAVSEGMIRPGLGTTLAILEEVMAAEIAARGQESAFVKASYGSYGLRAHHAYDKRDAAAFVPKTPQFRLLRHPFYRTSYSLDASPDPPPHDSDLDLTFMGSAVPGLEKIAAKPPKTGLKTKATEDRRSHSEYAGRAGERLVASILLFHHIDVSMPIVDMGADLITVADDFTHNYIQVKTVMSKNNSYRFRIKIRSFTKYKKSNMFYVFVLRNGQPAPVATNCLVFSNVALAEYLRQGHIQQRSKSLSIKFLQKGRRFLLGSKRLDVSDHSNNWDPLITRFIHSE